MSKVEVDMGQRQSPPGSTRRIHEAFARANREGRRALVLYLTACDPDQETSRRLLVAAARAGADVIELGVPWSDPSADGPAIQAAMRRALATGGGMRRSLQLCRALREQCPDVPVVLFGYANPIAVMGPEVFARQASEAGVDGVLCVDWPPDEGPELPGALASAGLDLVPLLAPTSTPERIAKIGKVAGGFLYYVSMTGITGRTLADLDEPRRKVAEIRSLTGGRVPVAVGFGISTPDQARAVAGFSDGVVVGSAAVRIIEAAVAAKRDPVPELESFVRTLTAALRT